MIPIDSKPSIFNGSSDSHRTHTTMRRLREHLYKPYLTRVLEAHNALSAKIVQESGFDAIWASSLTMSSAMGLRDCGEATWTQMVETAKQMADFTEVPIIFDGDSGYGNFNTCRRLVRELERSGIAGVCIEDQTVPKANSLLPRGQTLATVEEFSGKIKASRDMVHSDDFVIIARIEAFIVRAGIEEALRRAHAYIDAGADAVLIHSKSSTPVEVFSFLQQWHGRAPVVLVPTTYIQTPTHTLEAAGASVVIWANHILRAAIVAMKRAAIQIKSQDGPAELIGSITPIDDLFRLVNQQQLDEDLRHYS